MPEQDMVLPFWTPADRGWECLNAGASCAQATVIAGRIVVRHAIGSTLAGTALYPK